MKKTIFVFTAIFSFAILFSACKETKKEEVKEDAKMENHEDHEHEKDEMSAMNVYQCPMDCEKGKTYDKEGSCPVCKMDLKMKSNNKEDVKKVSSCKCKEGGECTCAPGECKCDAKVASKKMECTKCEPGKCTCKA